MPAMINPKDANSLAALGVTNYELGLYRDAVTNLKAAIVEKPDDSSAHDYLANAYEQLDMLKESDAERARAAQLKAQKDAGQNLGTPVDH